MDWYLDGGDAPAVMELRREIGAYLRRHADPAADLEAAEVAVSEVLSNVPRHAAGPLWVSLAWTGPSPVLEVRDLGPGFTLTSVELPDVDRVGGRGLYIASALTKSLAAAARTSGGTVVRVVLDVHRPPSPSYDPSPSVGTPLPSLEEALPGGGFNRESFLRALVVQLAQAMERSGGPAFAEAAVAQVGIDVGRQMEAEYRAAAEIVGRLKPAQLADCFVRLKHAIEGDFFIIDISEDRIELGTRSCPFGDVVQKAPALCRMTSSVFGGIAANNAGEVWVSLEERIAVGDPQCRVVVHLRPLTEDEAHIAHRYVARPDDAGPD